MPEQKKIYTIDDIARELGVSKTTVSRAISGKGRIGKATRERVLQFVKTHDYRPNVLAKALAEKKTYNLALVLPSIYRDVDFPFFRECMSSVCEIASQEKYDVMLTMMERNDISQLERQVYQKKVDGVIVTRSTTDRSVVNLLLKEEMPFIVIGPSEDEKILSVDNSNREGAQELTSLLLSKGMRRLALIGRSSSHRVVECNEKGYLDALRKYGLDVNEKLVLLDVETRMQVKGAVDQIINAGADGIICTDDLLALQVFEELSVRKMRVPADIKLASCYDNPKLENNYPPITSVHFDTKELGRNACRTLLDVIGGKMTQKKPPANYQVILRESTKV